MPISKIITLSLRFLVAKKWQYSLVFLGIFLGTSLFFIFISVTNGLEKSLSEVFSSNSSIITIQKDPKSETELTEEIITEIKNWEGVKTVYRETAIVIPFTFDIPIPFRNDFSLDLYFLYGLEDELFYSQQKYEPPKNNISVLINPLAVDLINSFIQSMVGDISLSNDLFTKKSVNTILGKSTFIPPLSRKINKDTQFFVSGFSSMAPLIGVSIPLSEARKIQEFFGEDLNYFSRLHIETNAQASEFYIKKKLEEKGLMIQSRDAISDKISEITQILQWVLLFSSGIILFLSFLFLFSILHIVLVEHRKTIGILQAMGMDNKKISLIFIFQGMGISFIASLTGIIFGIFTLQILQEWWRNSISLFLFPPEIFTFSFQSIIFIFISTFIATFLALFFIIRRQINTPVLHNILQID